MDIEVCWYLERPMSQDQRDNMLPTQHIKYNTTASSINKYSQYNFI